MIRKIQKALQRAIFEDSYPKILDVRVSGNLQIEDHNDGINWTVLGGIGYDVLIQHSEDSEPVWIYESIEPGFVTDLASVDGIPLIKINKLTIGNRWYVIHDDGYRNNKWGLSQKNWDTIMLLGLKKDGASSGLSWRRWLGVQLGGRSTWNKYRNR